MDEKLLELALVNHAMLRGAEAEEAWLIVADVVSRHPGGDVRSLADAVAAEAIRKAWPRFG